jgi:hypothetical protein
MNGRNRRTWMKVVQSDAELVTKFHMSYDAFLRLLSLRFVGAAQVEKVRAMRHNILSRYVALLK